MQNISELETSVAELRGRAGFAGQRARQLGAMALEAKEQAARDAGTKWDQVPAEDTMRFVDGIITRKQRGEILSKFAEQAEAESLQLSARLAKSEAELEALREADWQRQQAEKIAALQSEKFK